MSVAKFETKPLLIHLFDQFAEGVISADEFLGFIKNEMRSDYRVSLYRSVVDVKKYKKNENFKKLIKFLDQCAEEDFFSRITRRDIINQLDKSSVQTGLGTDNNQFVISKFMRIRTVDLMSFFKKKSLKMLEKLLDFFYDNAPNIYKKDLERNVLFLRSFFELDQYEGYVLCLFDLAEQISGGKFDISCEYELEIIEEKKHKLFGILEKHMKFLMSEYNLSGLFKSISSQDRKIFFKYMADFEDFLTAAREFLKEKFNEIFTDKVDQKVNQIIGKVRKDLQILYREESFERLQLKLTDFNNKKLMASHCNGWGPGRASPITIFFNQFGKSGLLRKSILEIGVFFIENYYLLNPLLDKLSVYSPKHNDLKKLQSIVQYYFMAEECIGGKYGKLSVLSFLANVDLNLSNENYLDFLRELLIIQVHYLDKLQLDLVDKERLIREEFFVQFFPFLQQRYPEVSVDNPETLEVNVEELIYNFFQKLMSQLYEETLTSTDSHIKVSAYLLLTYLHYFKRNVGFSVADKGFENILMELIKTYPYLVPQCLIQIIEIMLSEIEGCFSNGAEREQKIVQPLGNLLVACMIKYADKEDTLNSFSLSEAIEKWKPKYPDGVEVNRVLLEEYNLISNVNTNSKV